MKFNRLKPFILSLAFILIAASPSFATASFEGVVTFVSTHPGGKSTMTFSVKGNMTRVDIPAGEHSPMTVVLLDATKSTSTVLFEYDKKKMYMEHERTAATPDASGADVPPTNTGKSETLLGHVCEIWEGPTKDGGISRLWLASDFSAYFSMPAGPATKGGETSAAKFMREQHKFPMRMVELKNGEEITRLEATNIEPKSIDKAIFEIPEGYSKMEMGKHGMH